MFQFNSLNSKLIAIYVPLVSISLIGLFSIIELRNFLIQESELEKELKELISIHKTAFTKAVWEYDFDQIETLLDNIQNDPNFRGAIVYDSLGEALDKTGDVDIGTDEPVFISDTLLNYETKHVNEPVGRLVLIFHKDELFKQLHDRINDDALILVVLMTFLMGITFLVTRKLIVAPISRLQTSIDRMQDENVRESVQWDSKDELGQVVHAYNEMQAKQAATEAELREYKQHLETLVSERTAELEKNQQLLNGIVDNSSALIYVKQADGKYLMVNRVWCRLLHFESDEVIGKTDHEVFPKELADKYRENDCQVLKTGQPISEEEPIRYDGIDHTLISLKFPIVDSQGHCYAICGISSDITDLKKLEQELIVAKEVAEEANRAKSDFLANMSHEIRTPMNGIIGFTSLALKTDLDEKQRNFLNKIRISADALLTLINDILDFSKIEAGKLDIENTNFDLQDLLQDLGDLFADAAAQKNIELIVHKDPDVPTALTGDPLRVRQILVNLTGNAVKFTDQGEVFVNVCLAVHDESSATLRFTIRDTGIGIAPEKRDKLFSSFTQADGSTTRKFGGTGLGLAICRQLAMLMKGRIGVDSIPNEGSTFWCEIPFGRHHQSASTSLHVETDLENKKFLIVEDNLSSLEVLKEMLESFGFQCISSTSGEQALELLASTPQRSLPDAVLLDWKLPGIDGLETAARIRAADHIRNLPIIMITAFGRDPEKEAGERIGLNGFLTKPVQQRLLFDTLIKVFEDSDPSLEDDPKRTNKTSDNKMLSGISILLAEDNPINQEVALNLLHDIGVKADIVENGMEAVEAVERTAYDAVLMDMQMPKMDGYEATGIIRQRFSAEELPIIAMTAHAMEGDKERCIDAGMNDYVSKPIDPDILSETLALWVKIPSQSLETSNTSLESSDTENNEILVKPAIPSEFQSIPGFDSQNGIKRLGGNPALYEKLLRQFVESNIETGKKVQSTYLAGNFQETYRMLHTLKGVAGNLAATRLLDTTVNLEKTTQERISSNASESGPELKDLDDFLEVLALTLKEVKKALPSPQENTDHNTKSLTRHIAIDSAKETAARIREAASMGDLSDLHSITETLESHSYWADEIVRLTENFDFEGLEKLADELDNLAAKTQA